MKVRTFVLLACVLLPASALADQDLLNEEWVLPSGGGPHNLSFVLPVPAPIAVEMTPVNHADKGVTLRIVPTEDFDACTGKSQGACRSRPGFDGFAVRSFSHAEPLPAGRWTFYAANTENTFFSATVHVHLVVGPALSQSPGAAGADPRANEARATIGQIAKNYSAVLEREDKAGKPRSKRRLVSFPAVPTAVPRGVKYQSSLSDWSPWDLIRFSLEEPQRFQYEVRATSDGQSAEILARGDLNGDGKTSLFRLRVQIDSTGCCLRVAPNIEETDPGE